MMETPVLEHPETKVLDEILYEARKLSVYSRLALARVLLQEALEEPMILLLKPKIVIESFTPYEIEGVTEDLIAKLESATLQLTPEHAI